MHFTKYCRSVLFTPALAVDRYEKSQQSGADICLVDLEDSVSFRHKDEARERCEQFFAVPREPPCTRAIRINGLTCPEGVQDILAIRGFVHRPDVLLIPKVESPREIEIIESLLGEEGQRIGFMALIETPKGVDNVMRIAAASPRLKALMFGSADFSFSIGATMDWDSLYHARARIVLAAHAAGIHAIDAPYFQIPDLDALRTEARKAKDMGFSGKVVIHPRQIAIVNDAFSPDEQTLQKARKIVAQSRDSNGNICTVDGMMVGTPIVNAARRLVDEFDHTY